MKYDKNQIFQKISRLKTFKRGGMRAPHKPLLMLIAIGALTRGKKGLSFLEVEELLTPLLKTYAPPVRSRHQPELPYWHLMSDKLWVVENADSLPRQKGGFPKMEELRKTKGRLSNDLTELIESDPKSVASLADIIIQEHFPYSVHEELISATGIKLQPSNKNEVKEIPVFEKTTRYRDPKFRQMVLRAYEHRCAATGFRVALGGIFFGCEAAHVKWHACDGPDTVSNGIALEPTLHKLFDAGAWSLTDDRRILVSSEFTGSDSAVENYAHYTGCQSETLCLENPK